MKKILFFSVITLAFPLSAQEFKDTDLQGLANAERSFSAMAKEKNTRDAFLFYFADSAVSSAPGEGPRVGKKHLEAQQPNETWLYWYPVYSDISASGDFGFNTGPWEFRQKKTDEKPVAFGEFVSMWKKNANGEWRVAVDIGIGHGPVTTLVSTINTSTIPLEKIKGKPSSKGDILSVEKNFIEAFRAKGKTAYEESLSTEIRLYRPAKEPFIGLAKANEALSSDLQNLLCSPMGADISSAGDLAYVYGKASFDVTREGTTQKRNGSYMRFWKKEDGKNWKIILDLVTN
jgi:ketosteroid isomerase-like protein